LESVIKGIIFNIQRFSTEDGPGIRTTVFMKGCPLRCLWCHNVEGINPKPEIVWHEAKCIGCLSCIEACPTQAIVKTSEGLVTDRKKCTACGKCAEVCAAKSRELIGRTVTVEDVFNEVLKDNVFYETSGGGVTASGGEPTMQSDFVAELFSKCRTAGIPTALDTSGYVKWEALESILKFTDLVLYDLKELETESHQKHTGVNPVLIWENARKIAGLGKPMWVRTPIVPGYTDSEENIQKIAGLCVNLGNVARLDLLPYHRLGEPKYKTLSLDYKLKGLQPPTREHMERLKEIARRCGVRIVT
jgi:pyruvate formate lyase activating enzyme